MCGGGKSRLEGVCGRGRTIKKSELQMHWVANGFQMQVGDTCELVNQAICIFIISPIVFCILRLIKCRILLLYYITCMKL